MASDAEKNFVMTVAELNAIFIANLESAMIQRGYEMNDETLATMPRAEYMKITAAAHAKNAQVAELYAQRFERNGETALAGMLMAWKTKFDEQAALLKLLPEEEADPAAVVAKFDAYAKKSWHVLEHSLELSENQSSQQWHKNLHASKIAKMYGNYANYSDLVLGFATGDVSAGLASYAVGYLAPLFSVAAGAGLAALGLAASPLALVLVACAAGAALVWAKKQLNTAIEDAFPFARDLNEPDDYDRYVVSLISASIRDSAGSFLPRVGDYINFGTDGDDISSSLYSIERLINTSTLLGGGGKDILQGSYGQDTLSGGDGNDNLDGGQGNDFLFGDDGNDILDGGAGSDILEGGEGNDEYHFDFSDLNEGFVDIIRDSDNLGSVMMAGIPLSVGVFDRTGEATWTNGDGVAAIVSRDGADYTLTLIHMDSASRVVVEKWNNGRLGINLAGFGMVGTPENPAPTLTDADDVWSAATEADLSVTFGGTVEEQRAQKYQYLRSRDGVNRVIAGAGNDLLYVGAGDDRASGGTGDDFIEGGSGNDSISGGSGNDILIDTGSDVYFAPESGATPGHQQIIDELETITEWRPGNPNPDLITAYYTAGKGYIAGVRGSEPVNDARDLLHRLNLYLFDQSNSTDYGGTFASGKDKIDAGDGSDVVYSGDGNDVIDGGSGNDLLVGAHDDDVIDGGAGNDLILGDLVYREVDDVTVLDNVFQNGILAEYSTSSDIPAQARANGNDTLNGGAGNDLIIGGGGKDRISGDEGDDVIHGDDEIANRVGLVPDDDNIHGGAGNDSIYGGAGDDRAWGDAGDDFLQGDYGYSAQTQGMPGSAQGDDELHGGDGNDGIVGMGGDDVLYGDAGNDIITGDHEMLAESEHGDDVIYGGAGNDQITGNGGNDFLNGDAGNDIILGGKGDDVIDGGSDDDQVEGGDGNDTIFGGDGIDQLRGNDGIDTLNGDAGNDRLFGEAGNDQLNGGEGDDELAGGIGNDTLVGGAGDDILGGELGDDFLQGDAGNDTLDGSDGNDTLDGGAGNDTLDGDAGDDILRGGDGDDGLYAGEGNDTLEGGRGNDVMNGVGGNDLYLFNQGWGNDRIQGLGAAGAGADTIRFGAGIDPNTLLLSINSSGALVLRAPGNTDTLVLDAFFARSDANHRIEFADGTVWTMTSLLQRFAPPAGGVGTTSNDTYVAGDGADNLNGDLGDDVIVGGSGNDVLYGGMDIDYIGTATDNDTLFGGAGDDTVDGERGDDILQGDDGNDTLRGGDGVDQLYGGAGNDVLDAGGFFPTGIGPIQEDSSDLLVGGEGNDTLIGGLGRNTYAFESGFGQDQLQLTEAVGYRAQHGYPSETAVLRFLPGISASSLSLEMVGDDLVIHSGADRLTVVDFNAREGASIEFLFDDGSVLSPAQTAVFATRLGTLRADTLTGGNQNDTFDGGGGDDTLYGGGGNDLLIGGAGMDTLYGGSGDDVFRFGLGDGRDHIYGNAANAAGFDTLELGSGINQADVTLYRSDSMLLVVINATGNYVRANWAVGAADQWVDLIRFADGSTLTAAQIAAMPLAAPPALEFYGDGSGNTINGNGLSNDFRANGSNLFAGGAGDDRYFDVAASTVVELAGGGTDTVYSSGTYAALADNVENLVATEWLVTYGTPRTFIGNTLANVIDVSAGSAHQYGYRLDGGAGADILIGSQSDDTYVVDVSGDQIIESVQSTSIDTIEAGYSYSIADRLELENVRLTGSGATTATGNSLDNRLDGSASSGANTLTGGRGNDTYVVGTGDIVVELAGEGTDTVEFVGSEGAYSAAGYTQIEQFRLGDSAYASSLTGTAGNDDLSGNSWANVLDGGAGDDILRDRWEATGSNDQDELRGGDGNDTLISTRGNDLLVGGRGNDTLSGNAALFVFSRGDGHDTIAQAAIGGTARLRFDATVAQTEVHLSRVGNALVVDIGNDGADRVTIENYWSGETVLSPITSIEFLTSQGQLEIWPAAAIAGRLAGVTLTGTAGDDTLTGGVGYDTLIGNGGNDRLEGGAGDDTLDGGSGNDTYVFSGEFGTDRVIGLGSASSGIDIIQLDASYTPANTTAAVSGQDDVLIYLADGSSFNSVTLVGFMAAGAPAHQIRFSDGTVWTSATIRQQALATTAGDDFVTGFGSDDTIDGLAGNDVIDGAGGNDTLRGGDGNDEIYGGIGNDHLYGDAGDDSLYGGEGSDTVEGGAGNDTYYVYDALDTLVENASAGTDIVYAAVDHTLAANIERLYLTDSAVRGTGNALANRIEGNDQNNVLDGGAGNDTLIGGAGDDTYIVDSTSDVVTESSGNGTDTIQSSVTLTTLAANVENLTLTGSNAINATGNGANNVLVGNSANNTLNGGSGSDTMSGGAGDDTYVVDVAGDTVNELAGEGNDTVQTGISYTLSANVENLTLTGSGNVTGTGNALNNTLTGNTGNNTLNGGAGNDALNGGAGTDILVGGTGDDSYTVDSTTDTITELTGEGNDTVYSSVTFDLSSRNNVENLTLSGNGTINGTGNSLDNILTGNSANNTLTGGLGNDVLDGGLGNDTMDGGAGDDTYHVNVSTDVITEANNGGNDTVNSAVSFNLSLTANQYIENVTLTGTAGNSATGNGLANTLIGNSGANALSAGAGNDILDGGTGTDTLTGGTGNDSYRMARGYGVDTVIENDSTAGNYDIARFLSGVAYDQLWFSRPSGSNNLEISIIGTSDKLVVKDWYLGAQYRAEEIQTADGNRYVLAADVQTLVNAMAGMTPPPAGQTTLTTAQRNSLNAAFTSAWKTAAGGSLKADLSAESFGASKPLQEPESAVIAGERAMPKPAPVETADVPGTITGSASEAASAPLAGNGMQQRPTSAALWDGEFRVNDGDYRRPLGHDAGWKEHAPTYGDDRTTLVAWDAAMSTGTDRQHSPLQCAEAAWDPIRAKPLLENASAASHCRRLVDLMAISTSASEALEWQVIANYGSPDRWIA